MGSMFKSKSKKLAFTLLLISGSFVILLGIAVLGLGLAITHSDAFHDTVQMKAEVEPGIDYVQYWIGLPYIITGISVACSAVNLRRVSLTVCTITLSVICIVLSLAGLVVDGPDFAKWKNFRAEQRYWERQDGYACSSKDNICSCRTSQTTSQQNITSFTDCETLMDLSSIYGVLIACFVFVLVILFAAVILIVYIITTKGEKTRRSSSKKRRTIGKVVEVTESRQPLEEPVASPSSNPGYEQPKERTHTTFRDDRKEEDSVSQQNPREPGVTNGGMVMIDPGNFQLGDDDIY